MDLVQVIEMLADWKAATLRHADGSLTRSIIQNADRFGYDKTFMMSAAARQRAGTRPAGRTSGG
jgi:hypothetical protein